MAGTIVNTHASLSDADISTSILLVDSMGMLPNFMGSGILGLGKRESL